MRRFEFISSQLARLIWGNHTDSVFPEEIILNKLTKNPVKFIACNPVEKWRIAQLGDEPEAIKLFLDILKPNDVVYDIGASVGLYTVSSASTLLDGKVVSFEPDPDTRSRLKENIKLNGLENIEIVEWAVSDTEGETVLYSNGSNGPAPCLAYREDRSSPKGEVKVKTDTLDHAISSGQLPLPDVIKIDIEGAEILCLNGCKELLRGAFNKRPRILFIELHPDFLSAFNSSAINIKNMLVDMNYELKWSNVRDSQEHVLFVLRN